MKILHTVSSCTDGFKPEDDYIKCGEYYDLTKENSFSGTVPNQTRCCVFDQEKCNLKVIDDTMELINPNNDKCNDMGDTWTCGKAFLNVKMIMHFKPDEKYKEDTELKFVGCSENEEGGRRMKKVKKVEGVKEVQFLMELISKLNVTTPILAEIIKYQKVIKNVF